MNILQQTDELPVIQKTKELCQTILDQPAYHEMQRQITAFVQNRDAVEQYRRLCDKQDSLHAKQSQGEELTNEEMKDFEQAEQDFLNNPLAAGFIDAQRQMHKIEKTVAKYVHKTLELGRVPEADDLSGGCGCGSGGCGCH